MAKRTLSPEARRRISRAAKKRWAAYRTAKKSGRMPAGKSVWTPAKRAEQSRKIRAALARRRGGGLRSTTVVAGSYASMSLDDLIATRRRIDQELADRMVRGSA